MSKYDTSQWEIEFLATHDVLRARNFGIEQEAKAVRYPIRMLRYWFGYHLLAQECQRAGRPIDIAEIGIHNGQMLLFAKIAASHVRDPAQRLAWSRWLGVDAVLKHHRIKKAGYAEVQEADLEDPHFALDGTFDVALCLHILEHRPAPEDDLSKIAAGVRPGGAIIGGSPVVPRIAQRIQQRRIRKTAAPMGHVSVFSPARVRRMVKAAGLELEFLSGAFFLRRKGWVLEDSAEWLRFNLAWGQMFPGWPGEIYWLARKP
ncbi:MAG TPA: methyltransferase domain-containing protein [Chthoniobacterales bacterium]|nr:methyltransferase domain-containing protein [Chthoniobacterales bacterium]